MIAAVALALAVAQTTGAPPAETNTANLKDSSAQVVPRSGKPGSRDDEVVCRTTEDTGSRLSSNRRCMTRAEWQFRDATYHQEIGHALDQRNPRGGGG